MVPVWSAGTSIAVAAVAEHVENSSDRLQVDRLAPPLELVLVSADKGDSRCRGFGPDRPRDGDRQQRLGYPAYGLPVDSACREFRGTDGDGEVMCLLIGERRGTMSRRRVASTLAGGSRAVSLHAPALPVSVQDRTG